MPVDTLHPEYDECQSDWRVLRDVCKGQKAIHKGGERYLPKLSDQDAVEYEAYKKRATFFNATGRVVDALTGMVFRKEAVIESGDGFKDVLADITLTGTPFTQFAENVVEEVMEVNRCGVLVDFPDRDKAAQGRVVTVAAAQDLGLRVYATIYKAENIRNWRTVQMGGKTVLAMVVLEECGYEPDPADQFNLNAFTQYRALELIDGNYVQTLYRSIKGVMTVVGRHTPRMNGKPLASIPFEFFSSEGGDASVKLPVLYDLAMVNLAHYRNTADHEHGLHFTGLPTPVISGVDDQDGDTYRIGSAVAWVFRDPQAKAAYLEFKGEGLSALRTALQDKEGQMAALGARMLAPEKKDAETSDALAQKRQGETSTLAAVANSVSRGLSRILSIMAQWQSSGDEVTVKLNTDFLAVTMPPQQITALLQSVITGNLSKQSFYEALVAGEVVSGARSFEDEQALIAEDAPVDVL